jgi:hypothetical protein
MGASRIRKMTEISALIQTHGWGDKEAETDQLGPPAAAMQVVIVVLVKAELKQRADE